MVINRSKKIFQQNFEESFLEAKCTLVLKTKVQTCCNILFLKKKKNQFSSFKPDLVKGKVNLRQVCGLLPTPRLENKPRGPVQFRETGCLGFRPHGSPLMYPEPMSTGTQLKHIYRDSRWSFGRNLLVSLGRTDIFTMLSLLILEHSMSFHLFRSSLISVISMLIILTYSL